jgi:hypothetical protein
MTMKIASSFVIRHVQLCLHPGLILRAAGGCGLGCEMRSLGAKGDSLYFGAAGKPNLPGLKYRALVTFQSHSLIILQSTPGIWS